MFERLKKQSPHLKDKLESYAGLYDRIEVPAKTVLLKEGEVSRKSYYIEKGCIRVWFNNNGKETTFQFFFEKEEITSVQSFREKTASPFSIETIEPSTLYVLHKNDFNKIMYDMGRDPLFLAAIINNLLDLQQHYMNEFLSLIRETPQQRYLNLFEKRPDVLQRIPQHYIASYLGITPVHLSRIRSRQLKVNKK